MKRYRISLFINLIRSIFKVQNTDIVIMNDLPDIVEANTIYITGENETWSYLTFKCPCGCDDNIELNLNPRYRPRWMVTWHVNGNISITPSVNRIKKCRSHFYYKRGKIIWCTQKDN